MKAAKVLNLLEENDINKDAIKSANKREDAAVTIMGAIIGLLDLAPYSKLSDDKVIARIKELVKEYEEKFPAK